MLAQAFSFEIDYGYQFGRFCVWHFYTIFLSSCFRSRRFWLKAPAISEGLGVGELILSVGGRHRMFLTLSAEWLIQASRIALSSSMSRK